MILQISMQREVEEMKVEVDGKNENILVEKNNECSKIVLDWCI
jgi:hypothetical protein